MSLINVLCVVFVSTIFVVQAEVVRLPASIRTCKRDLDDYTSCLRLAIQESWPAFMKGIPELNVPPLDPFVTVKQDGHYENGQIRGTATVKNVKTYGLSKARFLSVRPTFEGDQVTLGIDLEIPKVFVEGDYKADCSIGAVKIGGKGEFNITAEKIRVTWILQGHVENDRWVIEHFRIDPEIGKMKVWFNNLFNGNVDMNKAALTFINQYWSSIYRNMLPVVSEVWDQQYTPFINNIFSKISFAEVFP